MISPCKSCYAPSGRMPHTLGWAEYINMRAAWSMTSRMLITRNWENGTLCYSAPFQEHICVYFKQFTEYLHVCKGQKDVGVCVFTSKDYPPVYPIDSLENIYIFTEKLQSFLAWTRDDWFIWQILNRVLPVYRHLSSMSLFIHMDIKISTNVIDVSPSCIMEMLERIWLWGKKTWQAPGFKIYFHHACTLFCF